jgi:hypothetical protein
MMIGSCEQGVREVAHDLALVSGGKEVRLALLSLNHSHTETHVGASFTLTQRAGSPILQADAMSRTMAELQRRLDRAKEKVTRHFSEVHVQLSTPAES